MKYLSLAAVLLCSSAVAAREINVADHGIVPGKDATYALNPLIESVFENIGYEVPQRYPLLASPLHIAEQRMGQRQ